MNIVGKTIQSARYISQYDDGVQIEFTDGTTLLIKERSQSGQIEVFYVEEGNSTEPESEYDIEWRKEWGEEA